MKATMYCHAFSELNSDVGEWGGLVVARALDSESRGSIVAQ